MEKELKAPGLLDCQGKTSHIMAPFSHLLSTYVYFCMGVPEFLHVPMFQMTPPKKHQQHTTAKARAQKKNNLQKYQYQNNKTLKNTKPRPAETPLKQHCQKHHENTINTYQHDLLHQTTPHHVTAHHAEPHYLTSPSPPPTSLKYDQSPPKHHHHHHHHHHHRDSQQAAALGSTQSIDKNFFDFKGYYRYFPPWDFRPRLAGVPPVSSCIYGFILDLLDILQFDQASVFWKHRDIRVLLQLVCFLAGCRLSLVRLISCCCAWFGTIHHGGATWKATFHRDASWSGTCQHLTGLEDATAPHWKARGKTFAQPQ